jgi:serine/threonine protein kinase
LVVDVGVFQQPGRLRGTTVNSQRWESIARIYEQALEHDESARGAFLDEACGGDLEMRQELETLLAQDRAPGLMDRPVWDAASQLLDDGARLAPGTILGPYQIDGLVAEGGMGQVFRATDSRLNRSVAIKVLPPSVGIDRVLRERFGREAQAGASLTHPHICTLYDVGSHDGVDFIVMEFLSGETLAARLEKGPLPLDRALGYAVQIAGALDHAHRNGIVHRDVKPANVMLTAGGVKLMDFGVAKLRQPDGVDLRSTSLTEHGTIVGTVRYMAPEQVEGKETDQRSDIFSLGAVIYEMVTGRAAFDGGSAASIMAAILEREPPAMATLQQLTPPSLDHVVRRCLAKQPDDRWQSAGDVMRELRWVAEGASGAESTAGWRPAPLPRFAGSRRGRCRGRRSPAFLRWRCSASSPAGRRRRGRSRRSPYASVFRRRSSGHSQWASATSDDSPFRRTARRSCTRRAWGLPSVRSCCTA